MGVYYRDEYISVIDIKTSSVESTSNNGVCENAVAEPIIDLQVSGNSVYESVNLFDINNVISGFLPMSGAYPTISSSHPDATYQIIDMKAGQTFRITYNGSDAQNGRIRCIDNDTNEVVRTVTQELNDYFTATIGQNNGFKDGEITALKDFKLGVLYLYALPSDFNLQIISTVPNPSMPLEIQSVGDKTSNLFDINSTSYCARTEQNLLRIHKVENGVLYSSGKANNFEGAGLYFKIEKNTDYNFSFDLDFNDETEITRQIILFLFDEINNGVITSKQSIYLYGNKGNVSKTFNSGECSYFTFVAYSTNQYGLAFTNIYLGKQEVYEPYGYKVPVKVSGKNIFNNKESVRNAYCYAEPLNNGIKVISTSTSPTDAMNLCYHLGDYSEFVGKTVSFSAESVSNTDNKTIAGYLISNTGDYASNTIIKSSYFYLGDKTTITATIPANDTAKNLGIRLFLGTGIDKEFIIDNIQAEISETATEYEPYIEPTTTNIYLSEPLRGVEEYKDYIDYKNKKVVRNVVEYAFNGDDVYNKEAWAYLSKTAAGLNVYGLVMPQLYDGKGLSSMGPLLCSHYKTTTINSNFVLSETPLACVRYSTWRNLEFAVLPEEFPDIETWKAFLREQYNAGTPLSIVAVLKESTEETIDIPEISTADGTNIFDIETTIEPSYKQIKYKSDVIKLERRKIW